MGGTRECDKPEDRISDEVAELKGDDDTAPGKEAAVDAALVERASNSAIVRKYIQQLRDTERLQLELASLQRKQQTILREQEDAQKDLNGEREKLERIDTLARELKKKREQTLEGLREADREEQTQRTALSKKFQTTIGEITSKMETEAEEQWQVAQRNRQLKSRLSILEQQVDLKTQQYDQLLKTREVELRLADAKGEHLREMAKSDNLRADAHEKQLVSERAKEELLRPQLDELKARFEGLQGTIMKSNDVFRNYKGEMQKMTKRSKLLDNERAAALRKYGTKKKAVDDIQAEVDAQEAKIEQLTRAGDTIQALVSRLRQEREDYEQWKRECPDEYSAAMSSLDPDVIAQIKSAAVTNTSNSGGNSAGATSNNTGGKKKKKK